MITYPKFTSNNRLSLENNPRTNLRWLILVGQAFGAAPVNITVRPPFNTKKQTVNVNSMRINLLIIWIHHVWTVFLIVLILASMISRFIEDGYTISISRFLDLIEYFFNIVNCIIIMYGCNCNRQWYAKYLNQFIEIDVKLHRAGAQSYQCTVQRFLRINGTLSVLFIICALVTDGFLRDFIVFKWMRSLAAYLLPNVIVVLSILQYCCILLALQERFAKINGVLLRLLVEYRQTFGWDSQLKGSVLSIITRSSNVLPKEILISLRGIFNDLSVIHKNANRLFGWLIIALAASNFVIVCTQLYTLYKFAKGSEDLNIFLMTYSVLWIILHCARIFGVLYLNTKIEEEKGNIAPILYQMDFFGKINMADIELCINKFSLQILHEKRYQTACGILKLDLTLVTTIVGALTTYLVILIQFDSNARTMVNLTTQAPASA